MPEELLERTDLPEARIAPSESVVPPAPPEGLDTILYEHDEREARADLRRQIAVMELALARLFGSSFPRKGIDFSVPGMGGPRLLSVDELEKVRDSLAARIQEAKADLHDYAVVEESNRALIEECSPIPARTGGCGSTTRTSASPAAGTGTSSPAGACSACCWAGGESRSPPVVP